MSLYFLDSSLNSMPRDERICASHCNVDIFLSPQNEAFHPLLTLGNFFFFLHFTLHTSGVSHATNAGAGAAPAVRCLAHSHTLPDLYWVMGPLPSSFLKKLLHPLVFHVSSICTPFTLSGNGSSCRISFPLFVLLVLASEELTCQWWMKTLCVGEDNVYWSQHGLN